MDTRTLERENAALKNALGRALRTVNDFFGMTDDDVAHAIDEAIQDPENFSIYRE